MILKLARHRALDRPMPRVMDTRSHLIRQQFALAFKKFDSKNAHVIQRFEHLARRVLGSLLYLSTDARSRSQGEAKNAAAMMIFYQRIKGSFSCRATDGDHG